MRRRVGFLVGLLVGLLAVGRRYVSAYPQYEDPEANDNDDADFDDSYESEDVPTTVTAPDTTFRQRIRRFGEQYRGGRTLSVEEIRDVKGAIEELLAGRQLDQLTASHTSDVTTDETITYDPSTKNSIFTGLTKVDSIDPTKLYEDIIDELIDGAEREGLILKGDQQITNAIDDKDSVFTVLPSRSAMPQRTSVMTTTTVRTNDVEIGRLDGKGEADQVTDARDKSEALVLRDGVDYTAEDKIPKEKASTTTSTWVVTTRREILEKESTTHSRLTPTLAQSTSMVPARQGTLETTSIQNTSMDNTSQDALNRTQSTVTTTSRKKSRRRKTSTSTTTRSTTPEADFDIPALVDIIANLTNEFESNLTNLFNNTLQRYNIPTCKTPTPSTTELVHYDLVNATVVAKCFVCGMEEPGIPAHAYCADAFAGDFLPLVPVDPQARGHIARFRKYCRYMDVNGYYENSTQPRSIYGRFTGGCSVRWVDLSGVYTQRACRNTRHTMTGVHFASKRMAKLEMALKEVDNGCIISPMASLVPLSRGVSLYARFHACVCTGSWCNITSANQQWIGYITILSLFAVAVT